MTTQSSVSDVLTEVQLHATLGIATNFILDDNSISHNGTFYGEVTSPYTGRVWLDRNLGASKVCASLDDAACYGDYYQWGRAHDGHQVSTSSDTPTLSNDVTTVGHGDFITTTTVPYDWASVDTNGSTRVSNWFSSDGSSVCPTGFRVPTIIELQAELLDVGSSEIGNNIEAFNSFLKFPSSGYRSYGSANFVDLGVRGYIRTISVIGLNSNSITFDGGSANSSSSKHAYGLPVRCIKAPTHKHNGTTYGEVISPYTGKVWLDRNLGAKRVCTSLDDVQCYGDYYQWGRNADGHEDSASAATATLATDVNAAGTDFITNTSYSVDWTSVDATGATRTANWSKIDGSSVCPTGFRVPNITELKAETLDNDVINRDTAFSNFLKLPSAGVRGYNSGILSGQGLWGNVWSISSNSFFTPLVLFGDSIAFETTDYRANGLSVRCIKD